VIVKTLKKIGIRKIQKKSEKNIECDHQIESIDCEAGRLCV